MARSRERAPHHNPIPATSSQNNLNAQCPMPNAQCSMPNAQCRMRNVVFVVRVLGPWALCLAHCAFSVRVVSLVPLIAFGVSAIAIVVLGAAGPVYRLGASLTTAYEIMRWAEYLGVAASLIAVGSATFCYRGR